jgi:hypothetical protein
MPMKVVLATVTGTPCPCTSSSFAIPSFHGKKGTF